MIGSGIGGLETIYEASVQVHEGKARRLSPFFIPSALINLASGHVSIKYGFKGPNHSVVTACATGVHAIGDAARLIMLGDADVMVAGGAEAAVVRARHRRVLRLPRALHRLQRRARPRLAALGQRPRRLRDGRGRRRRGARGIRARAGARREDLRRDRRLRHVRRRAPHHRPGRGARRRVPRDAGGAAQRRRRGPTRSTTSTRMAPRRRSATTSSWRRSSGCSATRRAGSRCPRPSRRPGTCSGAAGAVEAIFSILAIRDGVAPPTLNLDEPSRRERDRPRGAHGAGAAGSTWRCRTASASAAPTPAHLRAGGLRVRCARRAPPRGRLLLVPGAGRRRRVWLGAPDLPHAGAAGRSRATWWSPRGGLDEVGRDARRAGVIARPLVFRVAARCRPAAPGRCTRPNSPSPPRQPRATGAGGAAPGHRCGTC